MRNKKIYTPNSELIDCWWVSRQVPRADSIELVIRFQRQNENIVRWKRITVSETFSVDSNFKAQILRKLEERAKQINQNP